MTPRRPRNPDIYIGGWRLRIGLPLQAALPWPGPARGRPDVTFRRGKVPASLADPVADYAVLQIAADGTALARFDGIARFLLRDAQVICELEVEPDAPELAVVVFGNIVACICWRRGQLALHGSSVAIGGKAVMLLGRAATGKSMLAAALVRRGHCALSDEVAVASGCRCLPVGGPLSLADDVLEFAGIDAENMLQFSNFPIPKRNWSGGPAAKPEPYPIAAVICLSKAEPDAPNRLRRLKGDAAIDAILNQVFRKDMLRVLGTDVVARRHADELAAKVPVYQLPLARDLARIGAAVKRIERLASNRRGRKPAADPKT